MFCLLTAAYEAVCVAFSQNRAARYHGRTGE